MANQRYHFLSEDKKNTMELNEEPIKEIGSPEIIFVKEYLNSSKQQTTRNKISRDELMNEGVTLSPLYLEDNVSVRSFQSVPSRQDDPINDDLIIDDPVIKAILDQQSMEQEEISSFKAKLSEFINTKSFVFFGAFLVCILSFLSLTLIPYHNVILFPYYWCESISINVLGAIPSCVGVFTVQVKMIFEYQDMTRPVVVIKLFLLLAMNFAFTHSLVHLLWAFSLGYNSPIPFSLFIDFYLVFITSWSAIWYLFPRSIRSNSTCGNRFKAYFFYILWCANVTDLTSIVFEGFKDLNRELCSIIGYDMQWMIAILLFFMKKISNSMMVKYLTKVASSETAGLAKDMVTVENGVMFKSFVLVLIGSKTDAFTGYCFLGISILLNIKFCWDIIKLHNPNVVDAHNIAPSHDRKKVLLTSLMLIETADFLTTVAYGISIPVAYYGPNAGIIGNIQNNYWQYHVIESLPNYLTGIFYTLLIDVSCGVIMLSALRYFCGINGLLFFKDNIGQFALALLFCITREINLVSIFHAMMEQTYMELLIFKSNCDSNIAMLIYFQYVIQLFVHSAMDFTSNFAWIEGIDINENLLRNNGSTVIGCNDGLLSRSLGG